MDQLFASLAISGASLVGKAAFSIATNAAIKKVNAYIGDLGTPERPLGSPAQRTRELRRLERKLEYQLAVVNPAMDMIDSLANRGMSGLSGIVRMSTSIRQALEDLGEGDSSPEVLAEALRELVQDLEDLVPFLQLCLQTVKSTQDWNDGVRSTLSIKGALLAGHYLSSSSTDTVIGPTFQVRLYALFHGSARKNSAVDWTWKEESARCQVQVRRRRGETFDYELCLIEDLNDGRYHEETEEGESLETEFLPPGVKAGRVRKIPMTSLRSLYYATAGSLLRIEECQDPALVFKTLSLANPQKGDLVEEWWAMTELNEEPETESSDEDDKDALESKNTPSKKQLVKASSNAPGLITTNRLSDLESILKLTSLEANQRISYTEAPEEVLDAYLSFKRDQQGGEGSGVLSGEGSRKQQPKSLLFGKESSSSPAFRSLSQESPLSRRSKTRFPDSLI